MIHYRKSYEVIGYAYDADLHCPECALKRFTQAQLDGDDRATDSENNPIHPIFLSDEFESMPYCGDCHEPLDY